MRTVAALSRSAQLPAQLSGAPHVGRMLVLTAAGGGCFVAIRFGLVDAPVLWFAALRASLAGAVLLAVAGGTRRPLPPRAAWPAIGVLAVVNVAIAFAAMFEGTVGVASGVAAVLANAQPLLIVVPAWVLYQERPSARIVAGLLFGFAGLGIAASNGGLGGGALLSLGAAAAMTAGTLVGRRLGRVDVVMLAGWQLLAGGIVLAGWAAVTEGAPVLAWTPRFAAAVLFLALVGSAATYLIWFSELRRASLVSLSAWTLLTPVFGVVFGWLLLGDGLSGQQGLGVGLVLVALPIIVLPRHHRLASGEPPTPPDPASHTAITAAPPSADVLVREAG